MAFSSQSQLEVLEKVLMIAFKQMAQNAMAKMLNF
jgi:hypothetical protein